MSLPLVLGGYCLWLCWGLLHPSWRVRWARESWEILLPVRWGWGDQAAILKSRIRFDAQQLRDGLQSTGYSGMEAESRPRPVPRVAEGGWRALWEQLTACWCPSGSVVGVGPCRWSRDGCGCLGGDGREDALVLESAASEANLSPLPGGMSGSLKYSRKVVEEPGGGCVIPWPRPSVWFVSRPSMWL